MNIISIRTRWSALLVVLAVFASLVGLIAPAQAGHGTSCLDVEPEQAVNPVGTEHELTATLRTPAAAPSKACNGAPVAATEDVTINFDVTGANDPDAGDVDFSCVITKGESSCSESYIGSVEGKDTIRGNIAGHEPDTEEVQDEAAPGPGLLEEPDSTDVVSKEWVAAPARLDCDDENPGNGEDQETNPSNSGAESTETYTCVVQDADGEAISEDTTEGISVFGENENGVNDPDASDGASHTTRDYSCVVGEGDGAPAGGCIVTVPQSEGETGTAEICFWVQPGTTPTEGEALCTGEGTLDPENDDRADQVEKTWQTRVAAGGGVDAEPETATNELGQSHSVTVTVYDQFGDALIANTRVNLEFFSGSPSDADGNTPASPDRTCDTVTTSNNQITPTSSCTITYTQTANTGTDLMCVWTNTAPAMSGSNTDGTCDGEGREDLEDDPDDGSDEPNFEAPQKNTADDVDVVSKTWVQAPNPTTATRIDCNPETATNPTRSTHTITCTATNNSGAPVGGAGVDAEATGANDPDNSNSPTSPDFSCITSTDDPQTNTNEAGTCSFSHGPGGRGTTNSGGTTIYRAWVDVDGSNSTAEADQTEGRAETSQPGSNAEPDGTDVVEKQWVADPQTVEMTPEEDEAAVGECNPFTITVKDFDGAPIAGATIDVEQVHSAAINDTADDEPTVGFCVPSSGPNPSDVDESRGDTGPSTEDPDNAGTVGGETVKATDPNGQVTIGIEVTGGNGSNGTGQVEVTAWHETDDNDDPDSGEPQDRSTKTWTPGAGPGGRTIDCDPETDSTDVANDHTVTCTVRNSANQPESGVTVTFTESGPGELVGPTTVATGSNGEASVTASSDSNGTQTITGTITNSTQGEPDTDECNRAANDPQGSQAGVCSDSVTNTWTGGTGGGGTCPGFSTDQRNQVIGTEESETLEGTEGPDVICGLGGDDLIIGLGGDDVLIGGAGNDSLRGDDGNDQLKGNSGKDELRGNAGNDVLRGGDQNDDLRGNAGDDVMRGQSGFDVLRGGDGDDQGYGGSGNDTIQGFTGNDTLVGNAGDDTIKGAGGTDFLRGGKNDDVISGGKGPDTVNGGQGRDTCAGGPGRDTVRRCEH